MNFENNYASWMVSLTNVDLFQKPPAEYKEVARLTLDRGEMQKNIAKNKIFRNFMTSGFTFLME